MKKTQLLHAELSKIVAGMGHGDMLVIGDVGLPIPRGTPSPQCVDLALSPGVPSVEAVLAAIMSELQVERTIVATELISRNAGCLPDWYTRHLSMVPRSVPHEEFKKLCANACAMVRTGECTPYANVILVAGVTF